MVAAEQLPCVWRKCAGDVMRMPELPYDLRPNKVDIVQMRGINWSDALQDGVGLSYGTEINSYFVEPSPSASAWRSVSRQSVSGNASVK